jgi:uncharacterized protein YjiS (DUF1127 family)
MTSLRISVAPLGRLPPWSALWSLLAEWRRRIRLQYEVERLTERELADMRMTHLDTFDEVQKPFWQA